MEAIGAGQCLTRDLPKLATWIQEIKQTDVPLSVKVRSGVVSDVELARTIDKAGADVIHIDMMLSLIHISEPTRLGMISYAVFCLKKKKTKQKDEREKQR